MDYFQSYGDLEVHRCMLEDKYRNEVYRQAIFDNRESFRGKTVLDLGAGTGILSIFCAQAGAAVVYAVEASDIYKVAEEIVAENNFENVIRVIHSAIEDVTLPNNDKVDIIVSEWMGHFLLHEGMLDSVIKARDKFLRPNGLLFPENAFLYCAPCSLPSMNDYWKDVNGVSMLQFGERLRKSSLHSPKIMSVKSDQILSDPDILMWLDLREITINDINNNHLRHLAVVNKLGNYQGICLWFTCTFPSTFTEPVVLSTDTESPKTHWKQTVIVLPTDVVVEEGTPIAYDISIKRSLEDSRKFCLEVEMLDADDVEHPEYCICFKTKCILTRAVLEKYQHDNN